MTYAEAGEDVLGLFQIFFEGVLSAGGEALGARSLSAEGRGRVRGFPLWRAAGCTAAKPAS